MSFRTRTVAVTIVFAAAHAGLAWAGVILVDRYASTPVAFVFDDVDHYFGFASRVVAGSVPYRDFRVEYPPLAFLAFLPPRVFAADAAGYRRVFSAEMLAANALLVGLVTYRLGPGRSVFGVLRRLVWYSAAFAALCPVVVARFDLAATAWAFAAALAWWGGRPKAGAGLTAAGTLFKLFPGVTAVPWLADPRNSRRERAVGVAWLAAATAAGVVAWAALAGPGLAESLRYHLDRGLEIGSVWAGGLLAWTSVTGAAVVEAQRAKSTQTVFPWAPWAPRIGLPAQCLALLAVAWRSQRGFPGESVRTTTAAVVAFLTFGKVLSPQYLVWPLPFVACLDGRVGRVARLLFLGACVLTCWIYPYAFEYLTQFHASEIAGLNLRNALLVGLWSLLVFGPPEARPNRPPSAATPPKPGARG